MTPLAIRELVERQEQRAARAAAKLDTPAGDQAEEPGTAPFWARIAEESDLAATVLGHARADDAVELCRRLLLALELKARFVASDLERAAIGVVVAELTLDLEYLGDD